MYESYVSNPENLQDSVSVAQLNLVFGIAALSSKVSKHILTKLNKLTFLQSCDISQVESFESNWKTALTPVLEQNSLVTLQCLALAQIHCLLRSDHAALVKYRGMAVSLSHRLGLHHSQKWFPLGVLTIETRKKVFWTLYTLDW